MSEFFDYGLEDIDYKTNLPKPIIKEYDGIQVVRDDLIEGGTKRRAFYTYVKSKDYEEFVYASPRQGYAQLSLAYACKDLGRKATVTVPQGKRYWLTDAAEELGCNIIEVPMGFLTNIQAKAKKYALDNEAHLIPFGGDHPIIIEAMTQTALSLGVNPTEIWTVMSSGVLSRGLQGAFPKAKVYGVRIGHNTTDRERGRAETFKSKYKFHQECKELERPPFPSSLTYDSKAWSFIKENANKNSLFWNVGR
tara:strand:- start:4127 stop:4876 length:750 start_codon:yes stop_codon:yes gene_type:complete